MPSKKKKKLKSLDDLKYAAPTLEESLFSSSVAASRNSFLRENPSLSRTHWIDGVWGLSGENYLLKVWRSAQFISSYAFLLPLPLFISRDMEAHPLCSSASSLGRSSFAFIFHNHMGFHSLYLSFLSIVTPSIFCPSSWIFTSSELAFLPSSFISAFHF